nr:PKD domain-containing protein [Neolewinella xylanilytica]
MTSFWLEAECATVGSNWEIIPDDKASNQAYVSAPGRRSTTIPPADLPENRLRFTLERVAAGGFFLQLRAFTPDRESDSFWVRANEGSWIRWNNIDCTDKFTWDILPDTLELAAGSNTIDIAFREGSALLDKVFLSQQSSPPTGFGELAANCSQLNNQPPAAIASASVTQGVAPLTVQLDGSTSYDIDGQIVQYDWTWSGGSASGATPTISLSAGIYDVELTVTDDTGKTGTATITVQVASPDNPPSAAFFSFEAECTIRDTEWRLSEDPAASGNQFVSYTGCRCEGQPSMQHPDQYLNYSFVTAEEHSYHLFFRLDAPDVGRNSFWVRMDGGEWIKMWREESGAALLTAGFEWRRLNDDSRPVTFLLAPGEHTITVASREPGTKLDKLILSPSDVLPSGTGEPAQNCAPYQANLVKGDAKELVLAYETAQVTEAGLTVYPNPVTERISLELTDDYTGDVGVTLLDGLGRRVRDFRYEKADRIFRTDLSVADLSPGIYYLQLQGKCKMIERFVKQ